MKWLFERFYRKDKGFTLIELLIVIIILAVLAGIAIPSYLSITNRAKESGTEAEMASIAVALEMYSTDKGGYPVATNWNTLISGGGYMVTVPTKDKWSADYVYAPTGTAGTGTPVVYPGYTLTSTGNGTAIVFTNGQQTGMGKNP